MQPSSSVSASPSATSHRPPPRFEAPRSPIVGWVGAALAVGSVVAVDPLGAAPFGPLRWTVIAVAVAAALGALATARSIVVARRSLALWGALLGWLAVAAVVGRDPLHGWIGTPDRHLGWLAFAAFAVVFVAGLQPSASALVAPAATVAGWLIGAWSVLELVGWAPVEVALADNRLGGPYGQPAYLGAICALLAPITVGAAVAARTPARRAAAAVAAGGLVIALVGAQTRGAWVGVSVGVAAVALRRRRSVTDALRRPTPRLARNAGLALAVAATVTVVATFTPLGSRAASTLDLGGDGASSRLDEWALGASVVADRPWLGAGPEGYRTVVGTHIDVDYARDYGREVLPDRAHNGLLDMAAAGGVPAAAAYAALVAVVMAAAWRRLRTDALGAAMATGVIGFVGQQVFLFPLAEVDPVFWWIAGVVVAGPGGAARGVWHPRRSIRSVGVALAVTATGAAIAGGALDVAADHHLDRAVEATARGDAVTAVEATAHAADRRPDSIRYAFAAGRAREGLGTVDGLRGAIDAYTDGLAWSPHDPALLRARAGAQLTLARLSDDPADLATARVRLEAVVAHDPNDPATRLEAGVAAALDGDLPAAIGHFEAAAVLAPTASAPAVNLARAQAGLGDLAGAHQTLDDAAARGVDPADLDAARGELGEIG